MIFVIIINTLLIIWIYKKYIYIPKNNGISNEEIDELSPALIGYIYNKNGNSIDWILSEILDLNRKGYIEIEYVRKGIDEYEYIMKKKDYIDISQLKKYELTAYRFLFSESDEISISKLEEKMLRSVQAGIDADVKSLNIRNEIEEELVEKNIIDCLAKKILNALKNGYMLLILIAVFIIKDIQLSQGIILFIESILALVMLEKAIPFTTKGKKLYSKIKKYKEKLEYNEILKEKKIMHNILLEKTYADSIALNIMSEAKKEFVHNELIQKKVETGVVDSIKIIMLLVYIGIYCSLLFFIK